MDEDWDMIPIYNIEELTIEMMDTLVEKGGIFDVTSKASILSKSKCIGERDEFWRDGDKHSGDIQQPTSGTNNSEG